MPKSKSPAQGADSVPISFPDAIENSIKRIDSLLAPPALGNFGMDAFLDMESIGGQMAAILTGRKPHTGRQSGILRAAAGATKEVKAAGIDHAPLRAFLTAVDESVDCARGLWPDVKAWLLTMVIRHTRLKDANPAARIGLDPFADFTAQQAKLLRALDGNEEVGFATLHVAVYQKKLAVPKREREKQKRALKAHARRINDEFKKKGSGSRILVVNETMKLIDRQRLPAQSRHKNATTL